jgi:raffinose synthase
MLTKALPFPSLAGVRYAEPTPGVLEIEPSMAWNPAVLAGVGVLEDPSSLYNR